MKIIDYLKDKNCEKLAILTKCNGESLYGIKQAIKEYGFNSVIEIESEKKPLETIDAITCEVMRLFKDEKITIGEDAVISSARQNAALVRALEFLESAKSAISIGIPQDAVSSDIELALAAIGELDGKEVSEEVVADIFANFCVGK